MYVEVRSLERGLFMILKDKAQLYCSPHKQDSNLKCFSENKGTEERKIIIKMKNDKMEPFNHQENRSLAVLIFRQKS